MKFFLMYEVKWKFPEDSIYNENIVEISRGFGRILAYKFLERVNMSAVKATHFLLRFSTSF